MRLFRYGFLALTFYFCFTISNVSEAVITVKELQGVRNTSSTFIKPLLWPPLEKNEMDFFENAKTNLSRSSNGRKLLNTAKHIGYQFGGLMKKPDAEGKTDFINKCIFLREDLSIDQATLALAWELSSVINADLFNVVRYEAIYRKIDRKEYASRKIKIEAESAYWEYIIACDLGLKSQFHNTINAMNTLNSSLSSKQQVEVLGEWMKTHGRVDVSQGLQGIMDFYMREYDQLVKGKNFS